MPAATPTPDSKPLRTRFSAETVSALAALGTIRAYPKNTILIYEGERGDDLFILLEGRIQVFLADGAGHEIILNTQGPGDVFGEMMLDGSPRSASVMTIDKCRISRVSREMFRHVLNATPAAALELVEILMGRVRELTETVGDLALLDAYHRVSKLLKELSIEVEGRLLIHHPPTQQEIGNRVGCSREMVSRIFRELRIGGYIETESDPWVVLRTPPAGW